MHQEYTWLFVLLAVGLVFGVNQYLVARRRRELQEEAQRLGFTFSPYAAGASVRALPHPLFHRGWRGEVSNILEGDASGVRARIFDYQFTTGSGRNRRTYRQTVAAFLLAHSQVPLFEMFPERFYHWIAEAAGYRDIDFDGEPAFSDSYRLLAPDEAAVRRLFHPGVVSALGTKPGWTVEAAAQTLILYQPSRRVSPGDVAGFLAETREIVRLFGLK